MGLKRNNVVSKTGVITTPVFLRLIDTLSLERYNIGKQQNYRSGDIFFKEVLPCQISSQSIMVLAYYQWHTGRRFEDIVKDGLTLSTVMSMYILHEADEHKFVEVANEILSRNKARRKTRLYEIRKARGFTQQQLSDASGVTLRMIQLYEQRQNDISKAQVNIVISLANALGCRVEDLLE